jgi:cytochrome c-type biogenesis protein CcmH
MTLWLVLALMTAAAVFAVLWPLSRRAPLSAGSDIVVYRDQLDEVGRDRAAGLIGEREAEAARVEISRRLLAAGEAEPAELREGSPIRRRAAALAALVLLPAGVLGAYLMLGAPDLPGQPHAARNDAPPEQRSIVELIGRVEAHLEQYPEDGRGWEVLGPVYLRLGRFDDAVKARRHALRLLGPSAQREADLGEALTAAANGVVTADAKSAFERALVHAPQDYRARYFVGLAAEQDGRPKDAAEIWRNLLAAAPADAFWGSLVRESLMRADPNAPPPQSSPVQAGPIQPGPIQPGPSASDIAAADQMPNDQREAMIRGMVARLADRLKQDGSDVDGWLRLMRAYIVLGDRTQAREALVDARRALEGNVEGLRRLNELVKDLGVEG